MPQPQHAAVGVQGGEPSLSVVSPTSTVFAVSTHTDTQLTGPVRPAEVSTDRSVPHTVSTHPPPQPKSCLDVAMPHPVQAGGGVEVGEPSFSVESPNSSVPAPHVLPSSACTDSRSVILGPVAQTTLSRFFETRGFSDGLSSPKAPVPPAARRTLAPRRFGNPTRSSGAAQAASPPGQTVSEPGATPSSLPSSNPIASSVARVVPPRGTAGGSNGDGVASVLTLLRRQ